MDSNYPKFLIGDKVLFVECDEHIDEVWGKEALVLVAYNGGEECACRDPYCEHDQLPEVKIRITGDCNYQGEEHVGPSECYELAIKKTTKAQKTQVKDILDGIS